MLPVEITTPTSYLNNNTAWYLKQRLMVQSFGEAQQQLQQQQYSSCAAQQLSTFDISSTNLYILHVAIALIAWLWNGQQRYSKWIGGFQSTPIT